MLKWCKYTSIKEQEANFQFLNGLLFKSLSLIAK